MKRTIWPVFGGRSARRVLADAGPAVMLLLCLLLLSVSCTQGSLAGFTPSTAAACDQVTTCGECLSSGDESCMWCSTSHTCLSVSSDAAESCEAPNFLTCPVDELACHNRSTCGGCVEDAGECFWCKMSSSCLNMTESALECNGTVMVVEDECPLANRTCESFDSCDLCLHPDVDECSWCPLENKCINVTDVDNTAVQCAVPLFGTCNETTSVLSAQFSSTGAELQVSFSVATNSPVARANCSLLFDNTTVATLGTSPSCTWISRTVLRVRLGASTNVTVGSPITVRGVRSITNGVLLDNSTLVTAPATSAALVGSAQKIVVGPCTSQVTLLADASGQAFLTYSWFIINAFSSIPSTQNRADLTNHLAQQTGRQLTLNSTLLAMFRDGTHSLACDVRSILGTRLRLTFVMLKNATTNAPAANIASPPSTVLASDVLVLSGIGVDECTNSSSNLTFAWTVAPSLPSSVQRNLSALVVPPQTLASGTEYDFQLSVCLQSVCSTASVAVNAQGEPPVVVLTPLVASLALPNASSSSSSSSSYEVITLDASSSYDPEGVNGSVSSFLWSCQTVSGGLPCPSALSTLLSLASTAANASVDISAALFAAGDVGTYRIGVAVTNTAGTSSSASVVSVLSATGAPRLRGIQISSPLPLFTREMDSFSAAFATRAVVHTAVPVVSASDVLGLEAVLGDNGATVNGTTTRLVYTWSATRENVAQLESVTVRLRTGMLVGSGASLSSPYLNIDVSQLASGQLYTFQLAVARSPGAVARRTAVQVYVNESPTAGTISLATSGGSGGTNGNSTTLHVRALQNAVTVSTDGWDDDGGAANLRYSFGYRREGRSGIVYFASRLSATFTATSALPPGRLVFVVMATDRHGASTIAQSTVTVVVSQPTFSSSGALGYAGDFVNGTLSQTVDSDPIGAINALVPLAAVINAGLENATDAGMDRSSAVQSIGETVSAAATVVVRGVERVRTLYPGTSLSETVGAQVLAGIRAIASVTLGDLDVDDEAPVPYPNAAQLALVEAAQSVIGALSKMSVGTAEEAAEVANGVLRAALALSIELNATTPNSNTTFATASTSSASGVSVPANVTAAVQSLLDSMAAPLVRSVPRRVPLVVRSAGASIGVVDVVASGAQSAASFSMASHDASSGSSSSSSSAFEALAEFGGSSAAAGCTVSLAANFVPTETLPLVQNLRLLAHELAQDFVGGAVGAVSGSLLSLNMYSLSSDRSTATLLPSFVQPNASRQLSFSCPNTAPDVGTASRCAYWDDDGGDDGTGAWNTSGVYTEALSSTTIYCRTEHLTTFSSVVVDTLDDGGGINIGLLVAIGAGALLAGVAVGGFIMASRREQRVRPAAHSGHGARMPAAQVSAASLYHARAQRQGVLPPLHGAQNLSAGVPESPHRHKPRGRFPPLTSVYPDNASPTTPTSASAAVDAAAMVPQPPKSGRFAGPPRRSSHRSRSSPSQQPQPQQRLQPQPPPAQPQQRTYVPSGARR